MFCNNKTETETENIVTNSNDKYIKTTIFKKSNLPGYNLDFRREITDGYFLCIRNHVIQILKITAGLFKNK